MNCPCGSGKSLAECCEPFLKGTALPSTAEQLMRSRYTAYTQNNTEYLKTTLAPESLKDFDMAATKEWAAKAKWKSLEILSTKQGQQNDKRGVVEFMATYEQDDQSLKHHEVSNFRKTQDGRWLFVDGDSHTHREGDDGHHHHHHHNHTPVVREEPKVGRNDPCPCGSGKKYKKCCGAN